MTAQTNRTDGNAAGVSENMLKSARGGIGNFGQSAYIFNKAKRAEGSVHLFKGWKNAAVIHTSDGQKFSLRNINLNLEANTFESQIGQDSLFTFNFNNIKEVVVNGKSFSNYYYNGESRVFQSLHVQGGKELLKGYKVELIKGSANPMLNRSTDKYVQKDYYYIRENDQIKSFKLRKKNVLSLVDGNETLAKQIMKRAKEN